MSLTLRLLLFVHLSVSLCTGSPGKCFRASVVEHIVINGDELVDDQNPLKNVYKNLLAYDEAAERAVGEHAEIIVFPEEGLYTTQLSSNPNLTLRQVMSLLCEDVPDPRQGPVNPCTQHHEFRDRPILQSLSCTARRHRLYLVASMGDVKNCPAANCTDDGVLMYNTQVAFDRKGNLIARYHKYHLFGEFHYNVPQEIELVYFDTDFGARIGMYICFDRLFRDPMISLIQEHNVTTMALSTWFFDEYPFLMSHQIDQSWSMGLGINILSSNINYLSTGSTGSGIFSPKYVAGYTHDTSAGGTIYPVQIVGTVPVDPKSGHKCDPDPWIVKQSKYRKKHAAGYQSYYGDFGELVTRELVEASESQAETVCDADLCCSLQYKMRAAAKSGSRKAKTDSPSEQTTTLYFGAKNRFRNSYFVSNYSTYEQACFIVAYNNKIGVYENQTNSVFDELQISGNFSTPFLYPGALGNSFLLIPNSEMRHKGDQLSVRSRKPLIYAGIYGRVYDLDPPYVQSDFGSAEGGSSNPVNG